MGRTAKAGWPDMRLLVLERDGNRCQKCGRDNSLEVHHIKAVQDGGTDSPGNLITLCSVCHGEWGLIEAVSDLSFARWLPLPAATQLVLLFSCPHLWPEDKTAAEMREGIMKGSSIVFGVRSSID